jgi:hypothetical protein
MVPASLPIAALLSTKVLALVSSQMQALLPPPAAQMHKLWMKVRAYGHRRVCCCLGIAAASAPSACQLLAKQPSASNNALKLAFLFHRAQNLS